MVAALLCGACHDDQIGAGGSEHADETDCPPVPACDAPLPDVGPAREFNNALNEILALTSSAHHRGRDLLLRPGDPQTVIGKIAYGPVDTDMAGEEVDIWLDRGCGTEWELLGTTTTTHREDHATVEGVEDEGGRVYFDIPADAALEPGRHRIHLSVAGDRTGADLFIQVVPEGTRLFVSDIDGTLSVTETEEFKALFNGALPDANEGAAAALSALADRGYLPVYLTARPEWLVPRTREFLAINEFPSGILHTTTGNLGALGPLAAPFKIDDLARSVVARELEASFSFGNTPTDAEAYDSAGIPVDHRLFFQFDDIEFGGRRFDDYAAIRDELEQAADACE